MLDLGAGTGITSVMLAREFGFKVFSVDLWTNPSDNMRFFEDMGLTNREIVPLQLDVSNGFPFASEFFDAVVSIDSYHYFGRDSGYLGEKLLPHVKPGGYLYIAIPGMNKDCHDCLPPELLTLGTPEELDYIHDIKWWRSLISQTSDVEIVDVRELLCHEEAWNDWLACDNEYAQGDRKAWDAGVGQYLNSIAIVLRKK